MVQLSLASMGITDTGALTRRGHCQPASDSPMEVFFNGQALTLARWPDAAQNVRAPAPEHADAADLFGTANPDVADHFVKPGVADGVSAFAGAGLVGGLQYNLYDSNLGPMQPSGGATGALTNTDPDAVNHGFASIASADSDRGWHDAGDRPSRWHDPTHVWFHGFWQFAWADCTCRPRASTPRPAP